MLTLVVNPGLDDEQSFPLPVGAVTIGRTKDNDVFHLHKSLSRRHARIEFDGVVVRVFDLNSKNGLFFKGRRVLSCEVPEGETFRCGDVSVLVEAATSRQPKLSAPVQTLPSPLALDATASRRPTKIPAPAVVTEDQERYRERLFLLIRASEVLVSEMSVDQMLEELVVLAAQVLDVDRIGVLTLDEATLEMRPRYMKTFLETAAPPFSRRVVDWVVDRGTPASFTDVSKEDALRGDRREDALVRAAICVPINPGGGMVGVVYADSLTQPDRFRPDDVALMRAVANLAALALDGAESRHPRRSRPG